MSSLAQTEIVRYIYLVVMGIFSISFTTIDEAKEYIELSGARGTVTPVPVYKLKK